MAKDDKARMVAATEALLAAVKALPEDVAVASRDEMRAALKRFDAAEKDCDDAVDRYLRNAGAHP